MIGRDIFSTDGNLKSWKFSTFYNGFFWKLSVHENISTTVNPPSSKEADKYIRNKTVYKK